jgi:hypothetical protein
LLEFGVDAFIGVFLGALVGSASGDNPSGVLPGAVAGLIVGVLIGSARENPAQSATAIGGVDWTTGEITQITWDDFEALGDEYYVDSGDVPALCEVV